MASILLLVTKNCLRNRLRVVLTVLGIGVGVVAVVLLQTVLTAYFIGVEASSPNRLVTRHRVSLFNLLPVAQREKIQQIPGVTQVSYGIWFGGYYRDPQQFFGQLAVDDQYIDLFPEFILPADQRREYEADLLGAVIGRKLANRFGWKIGDRVTLTGTIFSGDWDFVIKGIYTGRDRNTDETQMFFHWKRIDERFRNATLASQVGWWLIGIADPADTGRISAAIDDQFINSSYPTLTETEKDFQQSFITMMGTIITIIRMAAWIVIGIILLIMANTMAMAVRERITEYGVLKTIGFRGAHLAGVVAGEALLVTLVGATVGCAAAYGIVALFAQWVEANLGQIFPVFEVTGSTIAQSFGLAAAAGLLACLPPLVRSIRMPIASALRRVG